MMYVLRGTITFVAIFGFLTVSAEPEENLGTDEEFNLINNGEQVNEDEKPSLDDSVDLQEDSTTGMVKRSHFRPRPYLPAVNCPYSMLGSPRCCGGKLIDNPSVKRCCRGRIILKSVPCTPIWPQSQCGGVRFDPRSNKCCFGRVVPIHSSCSRRVRCGHAFYDPQRQQCCFGRVVPIHSSCSRRVRCGHAFYDPQRQQCCNGQVLLRFAPCIPFECGGLNYNPQTHQCCNGQIVSRFRRCSVPGPHQRFCGGNFINPSLQRCCHGNVVAPLRSTCQRCGASFFMPFGFQCCHGNQVVPSFVQCNVFG
ncbi:hypothetical protein ACROYT_G009057 [Oculina patagonica]